MSLHRLSVRMGLAPILLFLGGLTAALQLQALGWIKVEAIDYAVNLDSLVLYPVLLFGGLVVYIINGTIRARAAFLGSLLISILMISFRVLPGYFTLSEGLMFQAPSFNYSLRVGAASMVSMTFSVLALALAYQSASNVRNRHPSRVAGSAALLLALLIDGLLFPLMSYYGTDQGLTDLTINLTGKLIAGLALLPLLCYYIHRIAPILPDTAATEARPVLDIFSTSLEYERRARYNANLLRTLSNINQLITRSTSAADLLQQTCKSLVELRDYQLVWIGLFNEITGEIDLVVQSGFSQEQVKTFVHTDQMKTLHAAQIFDQPEVVTNIARQKGSSSAWKQMMLDTGCKAAGSFPMRHAGRVMGILNVCMTQSNSLGNIEIDLLQGLADDLAHALISLEARSQQALLQASTDNMWDGLLILDTRGRIIYANPIIGEMAEMPMSELMGRQLSVLLAPHQVDTLDEINRELQRSGKITFDLEYQRKKQAPPIILSVRASLGHDRDGNSRHIVANVRDVTAQRNYEYQLLNLHRLTTDMVQIRDPGILPNMIMQISEDLLNADASGVYLIDPETHQIQDLLSRNLPAEYIQRISQSYENLPGETARNTLQPVAVSDTLHSDVYGERTHFMAEYNIRAMVIFPILHHDNPMGGLTLYYHQPRQFSDSDIQIGVTLSHTLAIVQQNAYLYQAEYEQRDLAEALAQAAAAVNSSLELEEVLTQILEQTMRVVPGQASNIMMIEDGQINLTRHIGYEKYMEEGVFEQTEFSVEWPNLQHIFQTGEPYLVADTQAQEDWTQNPSLEWVRGYIGMPLKAGQDVIGFLNVDSDKPDFLTTRHVQILSSFGNYASTAIQNARIYENSRRRAEEMAALVAASSAVSRSLDFIQVLEVVAEQMTKTLGIQICLIASYDKEKDTLSLLAGHGPDDWEFHERWRYLKPVGEYPVTSNVLQNNQPVQLQITNPELNPVQREFMQDVYAKTLLLLPIVTQDRTIGLATLIDAVSARVFTDREIGLGLTLAAHAGTALENASLYQQLQEYAVELEHRVNTRTQELMEAMEYIQDILESVPDAVFVLDKNKDLIQANQAGKRLLEQALQGDLNLFAPQLLANLNDSEPPNVRAILDVQGRSYQALSSYLRPDGENTTGQIIVFRDVTGFRELDLMKSQFVSDVSHELRTPLTNLTLYLGLLSTVDEESKRRTYEETLQRETERLSYLIEDLLTISRLEAGRVPVQIRALNLNTLVEMLFHDRATLVAQQNIDMRFSPETDLPLVAADRNLLTQAVSNLLTNATNYTRPGGSVTITTGQQEDTWVFISVTDTGVGIQPDEIERVFNRFYRGSASQATGAEGTGLGLAISKEIVSSLGGHITLESTPDKGSTFTIWLKPASTGLEKGML